MDGLKDGFPNTVHSRISVQRIWFCLILVQSLSTWIQPRCCKYWELVGNLLLAVFLLLPHIPANNTPVISLYKHYSCSKTGKQWDSDVASNFFSQKRGFSFVWWLVLLVATVKGWLSVKSKSTQIHTHAHVHTRTHDWIQWNHRIFSGMCRVKFWEEGFACVRFHFFRRERFILVLCRSLHCSWVSLNTRIKNSQVARVDG